MIRFTILGLAGVLALAATGVDPEGDRRELERSIRLSYARTALIRQAEAGAKGSGAVLLPLAPGWLDLRDRIRALGLRAAVLLLIAPLFAPLFVAAAALGFLRRRAAGRAVAWSSPSMLRLSLFGLVGSTIGLMAFVLTALPLWFVYVPMGAGAASAWAFMGHLPSRV